MQRATALNKERFLNHRRVWQIIDWIYPPLCCNCGKIGYEICKDCFTALELNLFSNHCKICGQDNETDYVCSLCKSQEPQYDFIRSWGIYSGILREIIHAFKFNRRIGLINYLTLSAVECIQNWNPSVDLIVPVPLSKKRIRSRGYNQSSILAKSIAQKLQIDFSSLAVKRIKNTRTQVGLNARERKVNVANAFEADSSICKGHSILLVDDIITTGSTLNECAKAIKNADGNFVYVFTLAKTVGNI